MFEIHNLENQNAFLLVSDARDFHFSNNFDGFLLNIYNFACWFLDSWLSNDFVKILKSNDIAITSSIELATSFLESSIDQQIQICKSTTSFAVTYFEWFGSSRFLLHFPSCWSNLQSSA